jgi:hypothetical protein
MLPSNLWQELIMFDTDTMDRIAALAILTLVTACMICVLIFLGN